MPRAIVEYALGVLRAEALAPGGLGGPAGVVFILLQAGEQFFIHLAARGDPAVHVALQPAAGNGGGHRVDDHVAGAGVEGEHLLRRRAGGQHGHVADAADVLQKDALILPAIKKIFRKWHQRRALPAHGHVRHAEVGHRGDARARGDDRALADLHGVADGHAVRFPRLRLVPDGLAVGADQVDIGARQPGFGDHGKRGAGVELAQQEVHIADPVHRGRLRAEQLEHALAHALRVGGVFKGQQFDARRAALAGKLDQRRVHAVHGGAGHHAHHAVDALGGKRFQHSSIPLSPFRWPRAAGPRNRPARPGPAPRRSRPCA